MEGGNLSTDHRLQEYCFNISLQSANFLAPGRCGCNFKYIISKYISGIDILSISCKIPLRWMPQYLTEDMLKLVQVMT